MNGAGSSDVLLGDIRLFLRREVAKAGGKADVEEAASAFFLDIPGLSLAGALTKAAAVTGGQRTHLEVAILGYAHPIWDDQNKGAERFTEGVRWLIGRPATSNSGMPARFVSDPTALLGITLGVRHLNDGEQAKAFTWLNGFLATAYQCAQPWQKGVVIAIGHITSASNLPSSDASIDDADTLVVLRALGILPALRAENQSAEIEAALSLIRQQHGEGLELFRAALRLCALEQVLQFSPALSVTRPTVQQLGDLLRRIPAALKRWTWEDRPRTRNGEARQWHIDNEYHVQNLLYFALAPIFPDLKEEDYSESVGHVHPRLDLVVPSLNVIIEVKYVREGESFTKVTGEIASDNTLYLPVGHRDKQIIVFVWDDSSRTQEHATLLRGLKQMDGVIDAIAVPRPGDFIRPSQTPVSPNPSVTPVTSTPNSGSTVP